MSRRTDALAALFAPPLEPDGRDRETTSVPQQVGGGDPRGETRSVEPSADEPLARFVRPPLRSLADRWIIAVVITVIAIGLAVGLGLSTPTTYTAEARVAVGAGDLSSGAIAGFPQAATELAANYARYVNDLGVTNQTDASTVRLSASQIPDSTVIRVEGQSTDQQAAITTTQKTADDLATQVNSTSGGTSAALTLAAYDAAAQAWSTTQSDLTALTDTVTRLSAQATTSAADLQAARNSLTSALSKNSQAKVRMDALGAKYSNQITNASTAANLLVVRPASISSTDRNSRVQRMGLLGLVAGIVLSLALAVIMDRRAGQRRLVRQRRQ